MKRGISIRGVEEELLDKAKLDKNRQKRTIKNKFSKIKF